MTCTLKSALNNNFLFLMKILIYLTVVWIHGFRKNVIKLFFFLFSNENGNRKDQEMKVLRVLEKKQEGISSEIQIVWF